MMDLRGDGEFIMRISRFIPDFISQTGNTQISFQTRDLINAGLNNLFLQINYLIQR